MQAVDSFLSGGGVREEDMCCQMCYKRIQSLIEGQDTPVEASSEPFIDTGHSTFSAPSYLRTFFQSALESTPDGRPEMTMVRIASGSLGPATAARFGGRAGFAGLFSGLIFSVLSFASLWGYMYCERPQLDSAYLRTLLPAHSTRSFLPAIESPFPPFTVSYAA